MQLDTVRFGQIVIDDSKIIKFASGIPGLEHLKNFVLLHFAETEPICWLQAVEDKNISLPVVDPFIIREDYALDVGDREVAEIEAKSPQDLHIVNVVVIPEDLQQMTANLAAPILINVHKNLGRQIVLDGKDYPVRYPIFAAIAKYLQEVAADAGVEQKSE